MKVTNISQGPRGFLTKTGSVFLNPDESADGVDMSQAEYDSSKATGWFTISGQPSANDETSTPMTVSPMASEPQAKTLADLLAERDALNRAVEEAEKAQAEAEAKAAADVEAKAAEAAKAAEQAAKDAEAAAAERAITPTTRRRTSATTVEG